MRKLFVTLGSAAILVAFAAPVRAAEQSVITSLLLVKDPPAGPQAKKIQWQVHEKKNQELSVVGDPVTAGAKLRIRLQPSLHCSVPPCEDGGGDQCFDLPASGWSPIGSRGFKYNDPALANGPVKVASIKQTPSGNFTIKVILQGAGIDLFLEDEIGFYGVNLALGGGDEYQTGSGGGVPKPNDSQTFRIKKETGTATMAACP